MVKSCVMKACHNREVDAGTSVRSFRFPMPGDRRKLWEEFTRHHNRDKMFKIGAISRASLCFEHFSPECLTDKGNLKRTAVPTIAPKFTAALALKYGLIPNERSALLDVVNNFEKSIDDYLAATEGTPLPLNPDAMDCGVWVDMPSAQDQSCHSHSPDFTAAEIVRMPVVIDLPMKPVSSPAPSPTKSEETVLNSDAEDLLDGLSDEENTDPRGCPSPQVKSILQEKQGSFDSTVANYPSGSEKGSPLKTPRKRHFSQLTEEDMSSPKRGSRAFEISQATVTSYQKRIKILHQRIRRKNLKIKSLEAMLSHLENKHLLDKDVSALIKNTFPGPAAALLERMIHAKEKDRYSPELTKFALTLNFHSPAAYEYVREQFMKSLPHPKTISKLYEVINGDPGFNTEALRAVKVAVDEAKVNGKELICALMCDEIHIRKQAQWTGQSVTGWPSSTRSPFTDNAPLAKEAWVFMLVAVNGSWKMPVGYFLINCMRSVERSNVLKQCLHALHDTGATVASLTFDGNSVNVTMTECLGAQMDARRPDFQPWFLHPVTQAKVFVVLDAAHMIKLWRNILGNNTIKILDGNNREIKWLYLVKLHEFQDREGLLAGNKVRKSHINFEQNKMNVRRAAQLLSLSTADALLYLCNDLKHPDFFGCEATAEYIRIADMVFDILNSKNFHARKNQNRPICQENYGLFKKLCEEGRRYICGLQVVTWNGYTKQWHDPISILGTLWQTGFLGFISGIDTALSMYDTYVVSGRLKFIPMYKLSQDHLETFFCAVRSRGGWNNNPNVKQFMSAYKRLLVQVQLGGKKNSNCWPLDSTRILNISTSSKHKHLNPNSVTDGDEGEDEDPRLAYDDFLIANHDPHAPIQSLSALSPFVTDCVEYIAGFVSRSLSESLQCVVCDNALFGETHKSDLLRAKNRGGLVFASQSVVSICKFTEQIIRHNSHKKNSLRLALPVYTTSIKRRISSSIFSNLDRDHDFSDDGLGTHRSLLISSIIKKYLVTRICHDVKRLNEQLVQKSIRQKLTKTIIFQGQ